MKSCFSSLACASCSFLLGACGIVSADSASDTVTIDYKAIVGSCESKNIILMICDGCGYNQIAAADLYENGILHSQPYDLFPVILPMATWSLSSYVYNPEAASKDPKWVLKDPTDSGASATAFATGTKTANGKIGVDKNNTPLLNQTEQASNVGKSTGIVSTMPFSHATPAAFVAHNASRNNYEEIARNMVYDSKADIIIGAGHPLYDNDGKLTASPQYNYVGGQDTWNQLVSGTAKNKEGSWTLLERKASFDSLAAGLSPLPKRLIGVVPVYYTLQEGRSNGNAGTDTVRQVPFTTTVPELSTLSTVALRILSQDTAGFFLMIEGGAIDGAGHSNFIARNIEEKMDFNKAVLTVIAWIEKHGGWENNLLVIAGDHETGYLTGPQGIYQTGEDSFDVDYDLVNNGKGKIPGYSWNTGNHTNQLVPLFAKGSCSETLAATAINNDPVRGSYTDNAAVGKTLLQILTKKKGK